MTLINTSADKVDLNGWVLTDYNKHKHHLNGALAKRVRRTIAPGEVLQVPLLTNNISSENKGGTFTLLNKQGI